MDLRGVVREGVAVFVSRRCASIQVFGGVCTPSQHLFRSTRRFIVPTGIFPHVNVLFSHFFCSALFSRTSLSVGHAFHGSFPIFAGCRRHVAVHAALTSRRGVLRACLYLLPEFRYLFSTCLSSIWTCPMFSVSVKTCIYVPVFSIPLLCGMFGHLWGMFCGL